MTTARSPLRVLTEQAEHIAKALKQIERGEKLFDDRFGAIAAARSRPTVRFAVAMDDKMIEIEMPWTTIHNYSEHQISEYVLKQMQETRDHG